MQVSSRVVIPVGTTLFQAERAVILATYAMCNKSLTETAETLRISTRTLNSKLNEYKELEKNVEKEQPLKRPTIHKDYHPVQAFNL